MNAIEEMGQDARENYDRLRAIFRESGEETAKTLGMVLNPCQKEIDVQKGKNGPAAGALI